VANLAAQGDKAAQTAITIVKQAKRLGQNYQDQGMSMEAIEAIIDRGDTLKTVIFYAHPDLPLDVSSIRFVFSQAEFSISVCQDTDQIVIQSQIDPDLTVLDLSESFSRALLQRKLESAWRMQNHRGYFDGIQLQFTGSGNEGSTIFQAIAEASLLRVFSVERWK